MAMVPPAVVVAPAFSVTAWLAMVRLPATAVGPARVTGTLDGGAGGEGGQDAGSYVHTLAQGVGLVDGVLGFRPEHPEFVVPGPAVVPDPVDRDRVSAFVIDHQGVVPGQPVELEAGR